MNIKIVSFAIVLIVLGGIGVLLSGGQHDKGREQVSAPLSNDQAAVSSSEIVTDDSVGLAFAYPGARQRYVLDEVTAAMGIDAEADGLVKAYRIMDAAHAAELEASEMAREGSPAIQVLVFKNAQKQTASMWADAYPRYSNIELAIGAIDRDAVVGGANAVRYQSDGLYRSDTVVVAHGSFVYLFSGSFMEAQDAGRQVFFDLVNSVTFVPEATIDGPAPAMKIDPQVACESALAYMLFENGEQADSFVGACVNGEHPDVIDRYIESLGIDSARI